MSELIGCSRCGGFLNATDAACPHCAAPLPRSRRRRAAVLLGLAGSASLGLTMMACYGAPPGSIRDADNNDAAGDAHGPDGGTP